MIIAGIRLRLMSRITELNILFFSFLINFVWEMLQMPLYVYPAKVSLSAMNIACTKASIGDALITVFAFWVVAFIKKSRNWIMKPSLITLGIFLIPGMVITIIFEALATGPLHRWEYAEAMPTLPLLGTGLLPVLQWLILPLISIFIVRRQLRG